MAGSKQTNNIMAEISQSLVNLELLNKLHQGDITYFDSSYLMIPP